MYQKVRLLLSFMRGKRLVYFAAIFSVGFAALFSFSIPLVLRYVIDAGIGGKEVILPSFLENMMHLFGGPGLMASKIWLAGILIVLLTLGRGLFVFGSGRWASLGAETTAKNMRERLYDHLQHLPYDYHVKAETGDLVQRCTSDLETVRKFLHIQFIEVGRAIFMVAISLPLLISLHPLLTLVSLPVILVIFFFSFFFFKKVQRAFSLSDEAEGQLSTVLQENLTGVRVVRAFANQAHELEKFDERNIEYRDLTYRLIRLLASYWSVSEFFCMSQIALVLIAGTGFALTGSLSIGELLVFMSVTNMLLWPIRQMGRVLSDMGKALVSLGRIGHVLSVEREAQLEEGLRPEIRGAVEFRNVGFSYDGEREILKDLSFTVKAGQTVAILGPTGSGKSSLLHLLPRLYDYSSGSILIDGVELKEIAKKWIRSQIGFVLQEPFLYAKSIRDNIGLARSGAADEEIRSAGKMAALHEVIESFDHSYNTMVGERGLTLSGGQKQRVAIARALITDSPILIFDDSLSAVDTETDAKIRKAILKRSKEATLFIVAHRLTTLQSADLILVLDNGRIVQSGSHKKLLAEEGLYRRVWEIQNSLSDEIRMEKDNEKHRRKKLYQAV